eukprot:PhM_4_TR16816/c2_g1_i1/m.104577
MLPGLKIDVDGVERDTQQQRLAAQAQHDPYMSVGGSVYLPQGRVLRSSGVAGATDSEEGVSLTAADLEFLSNEKLGRGSSGAVRKARHKPTGTIMALKEIKLTNAHHLSEISMELQALYNKGDACPYLITLFGAYTVESSAFLAMECMEGSLGDLVSDQTGGIPENVLAPMTKMILKGLHFLHTGRKLIHRDIKPGNLLYSCDGHIKITDFGVASTLENTKDIANSFVGTVTYMSPERLNGDKYMNSVDVWSLGISLVELYTGVHPYADMLKRVQGTGSEAKFWALLTHLKSENEAVSVPMTASPEFRDFVHSCVAKVSGGRKSAHELLQHPWIQKTCPGDNEKAEMATIKDFCMARQAQLKAISPKTTGDEKLLASALDDILALS